MPTIKDLEAFFERGWNNHDVNALMRFMSDDCVFESASGKDACGSRYVGHTEVRAAFARILTTVPDVRFDDLKHVVSGDRGISQWVFRGTTIDGKSIEVNGCDVFTFRDSKIAAKSSFLKQRSA